MFGGSAAPAASLLAAMLLATAGIGCGDDEAVETDVGPTGPPSVRFESPSAAQSPVCAEVPADDDPRIPFLVTVEELLLRPPGSCGLFAQCGHLVLRVDGLINNETSVRSVDLLLRKLGDRIHDGSIDATGEVDVLEIAVEVVNAAGEVLLDDDGEPLRDTLELITVPSCDEI